jgi:hypothetical protein
MSKFMSSLMKIQGLARLVKKIKERKEENNMFLNTVITEDYLTVELINDDGITVATIKGVIFDDSIRIISCLCEDSYRLFAKVMHSFIRETKYLNINILELHTSILNDTVRHYIDKYGFESPYSDDTYLEWRVS